MGNSPATLPADFFQQQQKQGQQIQSATQQAAPDTLPANFFSQQDSPSTLPANFFAQQPQSQVTSPQLDESDPNESTPGKVWDWLNKPLLDLHREGAGGIESGFEDVASSLTSPLSLGLAVATLGESAAAEGLTRVGMSAVDAVAATQKAKMAADFGFLAKYGYDLGTNTLPQAQQFWNDYRNAPEGSAQQQRALEKLKEFGTESVLNAVGSALALKGVTGDLEEYRNTSAKGKAMEHEDYAKGTYGYSFENQLGGAQAKQIFDGVKKALPKEADRNAIAYNIEAGGDNALLEKWASNLDAAGKADSAAEVRSAKNLSDTQIEHRDSLSNVLNADLAHLKYLKMLPEDAGIAHYFPHRYEFEDLDPETKKPVQKVSFDGERDFLKKRVKPNMAEAEIAGLKPYKDAAALIADYHERVSNAIAKNNLAEQLASGRTTDGAPLAAPGRMMWGHSGAPRDVLLQPDDIAYLKSKGNFDALLKSGRVYEVEPSKPVGFRPFEGDPEAGEALATIPKNQLPGEGGTTPATFAGASGEMTQPTYMLKQSDYVNSGLTVERPAGTPEELTQALTKFGQGPVPEQAIIPYGEKGIPTDSPEKIPTRRVPVYAAPEVAEHLQSMLESAAPKNAFLRALLKVSSEAKSDLLSLSPFHWVTIMNRTLESGMNPFGGEHNVLNAITAPKEIDYFNLNPEQMAAIRDGVTVANPKPGYSRYLSAEGLGADSDSIINRIPLVGGFNRAIEERLFGSQGWITSLKYDLYSKLKGEIMKSNPAFTDEQAGRVAGTQVNNKFGGLNLAVMGRSASTQNSLRAMFLAPDFIESTGRSVLDVAKSHGSGMVRSLIAFNVAHWMLARGLNYLVSGDTHPEEGFSVLSKNKKKEYNVRTTLGDFLHFITNPRDFAANRVNPALVRVPEELAEGVDQEGHKVSSEQKFWDTLRQFTPIPLQSLFPEQQVSQPDGIDQLLHSAGVGSRKAFTPATTLAMQLASRKQGGEPLEGKELSDVQRRYKMEDDLRNAIQDKNVNARIDAIKQIHSAAQGESAFLSQKQAAEMIANANQYPNQLQATASRLGLEDSFKVYNMASDSEKVQLRPLIQRKIGAWEKSSTNGTKTPDQIKQMRQRIQAFRSQPTG